MIKHDSKFGILGVLDTNHRERMKAQEREAIQAFLIAKRLEIQSLKIKLDLQLSLHSVLMKQHATDFSNDIGVGFSGTAADAARAHLDALAAPDLKSPIK